MRPSKISSNFLIRVKVTKSTEFLRIRLSGGVIEFSLLQGGAAQSKVNKLSFLKISLFDFVGMILSLEAEFCELLNDLQRTIGNA